LFLFEIEVCEVYTYIFLNVGQDITNLLLFLLSSLPSWNSGSQEETGGWNSSPRSATLSQACSPTSPTDLSSIETRDAKSPLIRRRQRQSNQTQSRQWSEEYYLGVTLNLNMYRTVVDNLSKLVKLSLLADQYDMNFLRSAYITALTSRLTII
jgi:hypothetical protein